MSSLHLNGIVQMFHRSANAGDGAVAAHWLQQFHDIMDEQEKAEGWPAGCISLPHLSPHAHYDQEVDGARDRWLQRNFACDWQANWPNRPIQWDKHDGSEEPRR